MEGIEHRVVKVNGINMHLAEKGEGPVILLLHGFPELWYSWRHQIIALSSMGFRAVAPDLRGFGDSDAPDPVESYNCFNIIGDVVELINLLAPDERKVFVVGHDWGAYMAWYLCMFRPDKVKAVVNLSVPFIRLGREINPVDAWRAIYGDDHYVSRFQEVGEIEGEFAEVGAERVVKEFLSDFPVLLPKGKLFKRPLDEPITLPCWLSEEEASYYVTKFQKGGFTGGLNYYRNLYRNWELLAPWVGCGVKTAAKFIVGDKDLAYNMAGMKEYIHGGGFKEDVPSLQEVVVLEGVGHFINMEKPDEITNHIYDFFAQF
ncbi:hypothetical protein F3Y22_tig00002237pilonHSYRG01969 [Hibiscus syriacus]|uniref:soluble epoxide hydrolase n=1 Tax=Hibiscus syriacus TaxID=106335 RepID=A0A6A3CV62_HIBSY|nr:epoxide hydrolase A-like [Hibiscus syriacus]KAE8732364.1 hypothetical protein F3Y22_tig00002237pilonHSYRG01969 [Hibiscus syriacus]